LDTLHGTKGLDMLVKKFYEYGVEKIFRIQITGSNLKVNTSNFPEIYNLTLEVRSVLNLTIVPELYLYHTDDLQGFTTGVDYPIIALSNGCIDNFTDEELIFIIGREIGHIKSQHVLFYEIGTLLPLLSDVLGSFTLGIGSIISYGLQVALLQWQRMSEYTADRAGLLACQNLEVAVSALSKISGLPNKYYKSFNVDGFIHQARQFEGFDVGNYNKVIKYVSLMLGDHKWTVDRTNELLKWIDSGQYDNVLDRKTMIASEPPKFKFCSHCNTRILSQTASFCPQCGKRVE
jgi:Zn-dependent protease with chaperone function